MLSGWPERSYFEVEHILFRTPSTAELSRARLDRQFSAARLLLSGHQPLKRCGKAIATPAHPRFRSSRLAS